MVRKFGAKIKAKESSEPRGEKNPLTKAYIAKEVKRTGKTFKEIKAGLVCTKFEKSGHIAPDCKSDANPAPKAVSGGEKTQGRKRGKNNGEK